MQCDEQDYDAFPDNNKIKLFSRPGPSLDPVSVPPKLSFRDILFSVATHKRTLPSKSESDFFRKPNQQNGSAGKTIFPNLWRRISTQAISSPARSVQKSKLHNPGIDSSDANGASITSVEAMRKRWRSQQIAQQEKISPQRSNSWGRWLLQGVTPMPGIVRGHKRT